MNDHPAPSPNWRKSSYSTSSNNCVEVASTANGILVRDSKDPASLILAFSPQSWAGFIRAVKPSSDRG